MGNASTEVPGVLNSVNEQGLKPVFKPFCPKIIRLIPLFHLGCVLSDVQISGLNRYCYTAGNFFLNSAHSHWLLRGHMTSNNETVSRQNL